MSNPTLHGREDALLTLRTALAAARQGRGRVLLISGDAGIGKSALVNAFAADAAAEGVLATWGRAWEVSDAPPYFPVWPCLRALGIEPAERDHGERHDEARAFRLWESVLAGLATAAAEQASLWIVEDLHAADLGTLDLLTYLAAPLRATHALIVATLRRHDPRLGERELRRLTRIARDGLEIALEPLGEADTAAVAEQTIGRPLSARALRRLIELTAGNPLFVVECARASTRSGGAESALAGLPPTVRQVVLDRVALLPDTTRDALASGSVLGREFAAASVARMHDSDPVRVIDTLLPAVRAGLLREIRPGQLAFSHALVCDAVYDAISSPERVRLHQRAEHALAALGDAPDVLVERARHALAAAACLPAEHVLATARRATDLLEREGAFDRAFALLSRVEEARAAGYLAPASPVERLHAARVARAAGRGDASRRACESILVSARANGDVETFARAALLHAADVRVAVIDPWQIACLEEAYRALGERSPALACRVLARLSTALQPADDPGVPLAMARDALQLARAAADDAAILDVLDLAGLGAYYAPAAERIAWAEELRQRALEAGDVEKALTAWTWLAYWHADLGDMAAFERAATQALELSERAGHPRLRWAPLLMAAGRSLTLGRFDECERYVTEVSQIAGLIDDPSLALSLVVHDIMRARLMRKPEELSRALAALDGVIFGIKRKEDFAAVFRAGCLAYVEDAAGTAAALRRLDLAAQLREPDAASLALLGEAVALAGSPEQRRRVRARLAELDAHDIYGAGLSFTFEGTVGRVHGLLDAALGDFPAAEAKLRQALATARARGQRPWVAQLACELARVLQRGGRQAEARALNEEHAALAVELGLGLPGSAAGPVAPDAAASRPEWQLERTGDVWTLTRAGRVARLKDSRGVQLLARLMQRSGEEIHVLALASDGDASVPESSAGELLDERARAAYRRRLAAVDHELAAAVAAGDQAAARRLSSEKQALERELARATGLGGRARLSGSTTERARVNVQRRLRDAIERVTEVDGELGGLLQRAVRTGTYCCFRP